MSKEKISELYSCPDLFASIGADNKQRRERRQWGRWRLDTRTLELVIWDGPRAIYFIDLERIGTSAAMLDWVFQVAKKIWCTSEDTGHLIEALKDIFDPQATLCGHGIFGAPSEQIDATAYLRRRYGGAT